MSNNIKWIKITTDMFDNRKIRAIRKLPEGNNIILVWVMLLTLAGRCNASGMIFLTENIPYTNKMLADELDFNESVICVALDTLETFGMISRDEQLFITINNWSEYQSVDGMERIKELTRKRMEEYRIRKREGVTSVGEKCVYCGKPANTVDHLIPKSKGGPDKNWNLVPCCKNCNSSRKDKDLADFLNDSFVYEFQNIDHELVRSNKKIMDIVDFMDGRYVPKKVLRNSYVEVTHPSYSLSLSNDKDKDKKKDNNIYYNKNNKGFSKYKNNKDNLKYILDTYSNEYNYIIYNTSLVECIQEWMAYKDDKLPKKANHYDSELGIRRLLNVFMRNAQKYGVEAVVDTVNNSMANNYQGIAWDRIEKGGTCNEKPAGRNRIYHDSIFEQSD